MGVRRLLDGPPSSRRCTTLRFVLMLSCLNFVLLLINYASSAPRSIERPSSSALLDAVRKTGILRVGSPMDYAPFAFTPCGVIDSSAAMALPAGSDIDLARALAQSLNAQMQIVATSWPHLIDDSRAGKFDIAVGGISITLERLRDVGFSASTSPPTPKVIVARCADAALLRGGVELDVPSTVVAVNPGGTNEIAVRRALPNATVRLVAQYAQYEEVQSGAANLTVTDTVEAELQSRRRAGQLCKGASLHDGHGALAIAAQPKGFLLPRRDDVSGKAYIDHWIEQERAMINATMHMWLERSVNTAPPCR